MASRVRLAAGGVNKKRMRASSLVLSSPLARARALALARARRVQRVFDLVNFDSPEDGDGTLDEVRAVFLTCLSRGARARGGGGGGRSHQRMLRRRRNMR